MGAAEFWRFKAAVFLRTLACGPGVAEMLGVWKKRWKGAWKESLRLALGPYMYGGLAGKERLSLSGGRMNAGPLSAVEVYRRLSVFSRRQGVEGEEFYSNLYRGVFLVAGREFSGYALRSPCSRVGDPASVAAAAAAASNFVARKVLAEEEGEGAAGYIVSFSLGSVQSFISRSRTTRDLYVSSLLSSLLAWYAVKVFVERLGPDVLVAPSPVGNRLLEASLVSSMAKSGFGLEVLESLSALGYSVPYTLRGDSVYMDMGVTVSSPSLGLLVLPDEEVLGSVLGGRWGEERIAETLIRRYVDGWRSVISQARCCYQDEELLEAFEKIAGSPPQPPRVKIIRVAPGELKGRKGGERLGDLLVAIQGMGGKYRRFLEERGLKWSGGAEVWGSTGSIVGSLWPGYRGLTDETLEDYREGVSRRLCSVCGALPAHVADDGSPLSRRLRRDGVLRMGERLCPYCLLRRVLGAKRCLEGLYGALLGVNVDVDSSEVPTTSDFGAYGFRLLVDRALGRSVLGGELRRLLERYWEALKEAYGEERIKEFPRVDGYVSRFFPNLRRWRDELKKLFTVAAEEAFYNSSSPSLLSERLGVSRGEAGELSRGFSEVRKAVAREVVKLGLERLVGPSPFNTYYALLRSDVDGGGMFRRGILPPSLASNVSEEMPYTYKEGGERILFQMALVMLVHYSSLMNRLAASLSRVARRYGGWVVFSSGDDLLMLVPVTRALEAARAVREEMRGDEELRLFTRSTAILASHYKAPMYAAISEVTRLLDDYAKKFSTRDGYVKDALAVGVMPRGSLKAEAAILPLSSLDRKERYASENMAVSLLNMVYEELLVQAAGGRGLLSVNMMYDYLMNYSKYAGSGDVEAALLEIVHLRNLRSARSDVAEALKNYLEREFRDVAGAEAVVDNHSVSLVDEFFKALRFLFVASRGG